MGRVFNIQRFSLHDGPGIRTVVFLKGCQMRCIWCANPEGLRQESDVLWRAVSCEHCGACVDACQNGIHQWDGQRHVMNASASCSGCHRCEEACPAQALKVVGRRMSSDEVHQEVIKDVAYYQLSGGGVTLSGGEVMLQPDFAARVLQRLRREGIHTAVETAGFAPWSAVAKVSTAANLVLYDLKLADDTLHQRFTGVSNIRILRNLEKLLTLNIPLRLRVPVIPGINDTSEEISKMLELISNMTAGKICFQGVDLLPYHAYGVQKYSLLGRDYPARNLIRHETERNGEVFLQAAKARGIPTTLSTSMMG